MEYVSENTELVISIASDSMRIFIISKATSFCRTIFLSEKIIHTILVDDGLYIITEYMIEYHCFCEYTTKVLIRANNLIIDSFNTIWNKCIYIIVNYIDNCAILYSSIKADELIPILKIENTYIDNLLISDNGINIIDYKNNTIYQSGDGKKFDKYKICGK